MPALILSSVSEKISSSYVLPVEESGRSSRISVAKAWTSLEFEHPITLLSSSSSSSVAAAAVVAVLLFSLSLSLFLSLSLSLSLLIPATALEC